MNTNNDDSLNQTNESPKTSPEPARTKIRSDDIVVLCALPNGNVHEVALTRPMRATVLSLIVQLHGGELKLMEQAIEGMKTTSIPLQPVEKSSLLLPPSGILKARR